MTGLRYIGSAATAHRTTVPRHFSPYVQWVGAHFPFRPSSAVSLRIAGDGKLRMTFLRPQQRGLQDTLLRVRKGGGPTPSAGPR